MNELEKYGPLNSLIGNWKSTGFSGENRAPDPNLDVENTKFRQEMSFDPIGEVENHSQSLYALRYSTKAWEEGNDDEPFHEEVGYFIWDDEAKQVYKSFIVPRGISVNAIGLLKDDCKSFKLKAELGSNTNGVCSNPFLDENFRTLSYEVEFDFIDDTKFSYYENTRIQIKGKPDVFDHIEKNTMEKTLN